VAVVRRAADGRFLIVHERKHGQLWYLPAGRVETAETFVEAAVRETMEEAGVPVRVVGVIRVEHTPRDAYARMRVVFLAEPVDDRPAKTEADEESLGAAWVSVEELAEYRLRGEEVREILRYVARGGEVYEMGVLRGEGEGYEAPWRPAE
jgi:phosphatase NudJ